MYEGFHNRTPAWRAKNQTEMKLAMMKEPVGVSGKTTYPFEYSPSPCTSGSAFRRAGLHRGYGPSHHGSRES